MHPSCGNIKLIKYTLVVRTFMNHNSKLKVLLALCNIFDGLKLWEHEINLIHISCDDFYQSQFKIERFACLSNISDAHKLLEH